MMYKLFFSTCTVLLYKRRLYDLEILKYIKQQPGNWIHVLTVNELTKNNLQYFFFFVEVNSHISNISWVSKTLELQFVDLTKRLFVM